jgi:hypothetical protein
MIYSHRAQLRMLITQLVRERQLRRPLVPPFDPISHGDRDIVRLAKDENIHVCWHEPAEDDYRMACICSWRGEVSPDIAARACEGIDHVSDAEKI